MFSLIAGKQGCGKTKTLIEMANERAKTSNGSSVFIDDDKRHVYDLPHKVRYISTQDLPIQTPQEFFGFICGLMASDYDLENLYIDGLKKTMKGSLEEITEVAKKIEIFSEINNVDVVATISSEVEDLTEGLKEFLLA
jgi:ABC-type multidrug transport system ATPase subunit